MNVQQRETEIVHNFSSKLFRAIYGEYFRNSFSSVITASEDQQKQNEQNVNFFCR